MDYSRTEQEVNLLASGESASLMVVLATANIACTSYMAEDDSLRSYPLSVVFR